MLTATANPTAAVTHNVAAVVKPLVVTPDLNITPAPIKPIPLTICAAILEGSTMLL